MRGDEGGGEVGSERGKERGKRREADKRGAEDREEPRERWRGDTGPAAEEGKRGWRLDRFRVRAGWEVLRLQQVLREYDMTS